MQIPRQMVVSDGSTSTGFIVLSLAITIASVGLARCLVPELLVTRITDGANGRSAQGWLRLL